MLYSEAARPSATVVMIALAPLLDVTSSLLNYIINVLSGVTFFPVPHRSLTGTRCILPASHSP